MILTNALFFNLRHKEKQYKKTKQTKLKDAKKKA